MDDVSKMVTLGPPKIKVLWNKVYDVYFFYDVTNKTFLRDSSYIVNGVMWPKFGSSSISMREVIITSIHFYKDFTRITTCFWEVVLVLAQ